MLPDKTREEFGGCPSDFPSKKFSGMKNVDWLYNMDAWNSSVD